MKLVKCDESAFQALDGAPPFGIIFTRMGKEENAPWWRTVQSCDDYVPIAAAVGPQALDIDLPFDGGALAKVAEDPSYLLQVARSASPWLRPCLPSDMLLDSLPACQGSEPRNIAELFEARGRASDAGALVAVAALSPFGPEAAATNAMLRTRLAGVMRAIRSAIAVDDSQNRKFYKLLINHGRHDLDRGRSARSLDAETRAVLQLSTAARPQVQAVPVTSGLIRGAWRTARQLTQKRLQRPMVCRLYLKAPAGGLPETVDGSILLRIALDNLLRNALQVAESVPAKGGDRIVVHAKSGNIVIQHPVRGSDWSAFVKDMRAEGYLKTPGKGLGVAWQCLDLLGWGWRVSDDSPGRMELSAQAGGFERG
jgi:signal transduction histidine kinase